MGVSHTEGEHEIVWSYTPPGLHLECFISISSLLLLIFLWKQNENMIIKIVSEIVMILEIIFRVFAGAVLL